MKKGNKKTDKVKKVVIAIEPKVRPTFQLPYTNPYGSNQFLLDPRQKVCWEYYINPKSKTFGNASQSAIRAGYERSYSDTITQSEWFCVKVRRLNMLSKAEKVLEETLNVDPIVKKIGMYGPVIDPQTKEYIYEVDPSLLKIKQDTAKFLAETQGKNEGYAKRSELTGKDGEKLIDLKDEEKAMVEQALKKMK